MIFFDKYSLKFRLVTENDAAFILGLRTNPLKSKHISPTDNDVDKQKVWIREYKKREEAGDEFYFVITDEDSMDFATYRIYNKTESTIEVGSFISIPSYKKPVNVVKVDIIMKTFVFDELGYNSLCFEVRKENTSVIEYHKKYHPKIIGEDNLNLYFLLEKDIFNDNKIRFNKLF
jgi:hypothetical protein